MRLLSADRFSLEMCQKSDAVGQKTSYCFRPPFLHFPVQPVTSFMAPPLVFWVLSSGPDSSVLLLLGLVSRQNFDNLVIIGGAARRSQAVQQLCGRSCLCLALLRVPSIPERLDVQWRSSFSPRSEECWLSHRSQAGGW